ncbi:hypothetical protein F511_03454 [Dorcoceras hygrometricum]|uniref:Uncharacterized protein n=1 Tax=Dorcoceras hygrometricum TaxID=472368 RepID=A0A2Z7DEX3_9LAMI|nr:hypothetical protein F511_03454 [Dorcoceras hygrometricum]
MTSRIQSKYVFPCVAIRILPEYVFPYLCDKIAGDHGEYLVRDTRCRRIFARICSPPPPSPSINTRHPEQPLSNRYQSRRPTSRAPNRRKTKRRKNQLLVAILAFCGILRNQSTGAKIQTLAREFQQFLHEYRSVVELERKSAATQIQQRRNFSGDANSAATQTSSSPRNFIIQISRNPDFCSRT